MKQLLLVILVCLPWSVSSQEECVPSSDNLQALAKVVGKKCLQEISKDELADLVVTKDEYKAFCEKCNNETLKSSVNKKDGKEELESMYAKGTLQEFQKELTFISLDLMKLRSSFRMPFKPDKAIQSCNFSKLNKPKCLSPDQLKKYDKQVLGMKNALATEISSILSDKPNEKEGLLIRDESENSCHILDQDALFAQTRYQESLINPKFISELRSRLANKESVKSLLENNKDSSSFKTDLKILSSHPIFQALLNDPRNLNSFLSESAALNSSSSIIEKLYESKVGQNFGDEIDSKCKSLFEKTSSYLNDIYCKETHPFVADNLTAIEGVVGQPVQKLGKEDAESDLQIFCSHINSVEASTPSFNNVRENLSPTREQTFVKQPLASFKSNLGISNYKTSKYNICQASKLNPPCEKESLDASCKMYHFYNLLKTSKPYQALAKSSDDNINLILRSMIGDGVPQKDGKVDATAVALLKSEGILPGGDTSSRPPQQTAAAFNKTVNSAATPRPQQAAKPASAPTFPSKPEEAQPSYAQSAARESDSDVDQDSPSSRSDSPTKHKSPKKQNSKFSNLSDDEQQRIMDMMKRSKKAGGKTPTAASSDEQDSSEDAFDSAGSSMANIAAQTAASGASIANVAQKAASAGATAGKKAVLDPTKKSSSLNDAMVDANNNRQLASSGSSLTSSNAQVSISKSGTNENEIKIKVADAELNQVNEFKEKLKVLLNAHSQEISVAGDGEKFVVKLNNFEINVVFNKQLGTYEALCKDSSIPKDYLKTISTYFNVTLKGSTGQREALVNTLKQ